MNLSFSVLAISKTIVALRVGFRVSAVGLMIGNAVKCTVTTVYNEEAIALNLIF